MSKPLLFGDTGLTSEQADHNREMMKRWDSSYVPGYSEKKHENEILVAKGRKPVPIPRLQWIRVVGTHGEDVGTAEMIEWYHLGYQFATKEDMDSMGFGMPPGASIDAAGRIRRIDSALAFVDEERAEANRAYAQKVAAEARGVSYKEDIPGERKQVSLSASEMKTLVEGEQGDDPWA